MEVEKKESIFVNFESSLQEYYEFEPDIDNVYAQGYIVANVLSPEPLAINEILKHITDNSLDLPKDKLAVLEGELAQLMKGIERIINQENTEASPLPNKIPMPTQNLMHFWCMGFMELQMLQDEIWKNAIQSEDDMYHALLPIMQLSLLFNKEEVFKEFSQDQEMLNKFYLAIPDLVVDLYLQLRSK